MAQLTPTGLVKLLGLVTLIMVIPMVGGSVAGLVLDRVFGTSPLLVVIGLAVGSLIAATGIWLLIRAGARRGFGGGTSHGA
jgi:F0F1-type ATP synthase assembly protein I